MVLWQGGGLSNNASDGTNWQGGLPPDPGQSAEFTGFGFDVVNFDLPGVSVLEIGGFGAYQITLANDIDVTNTNLDGSGGARLFTAGFDISFTGSYISDNGCLVAQLGSAIRNVGAGSSSMNAPDQMIDFIVERTGGSLNIIDRINVSGLASFDCTNGSFDVDWADGVPHNINQMLTLGAPGNLVTMQSNSPGSPVDWNITDPSGIQQYAAFQDIAVVGGPLVADDTCVNNGNNSGITFDTGPVTCDTKLIRAALLAMCRTEKVATAAGVDPLEWAEDTGRVRVIAEETPGIPNRGRLPMVQILFAGYSRFPVITGAEGGGEGNMLWTIRVHTGGVSKQAQQELSECISQACLEQIRAPVVDPDAFPVEGSDNMGIHEIRAAWHVQDTTVSIDANYCIPAVP